MARKRKAKPHTGRDSCGRIKAGYRLTCAGRVIKVTKKRRRKRG